MIRLLLLSLAWATSSVAAAPSPPADLLLVADDEALQPLVGQLADPTVNTFAAWTVWQGTLAGKNVALARSEGDPLNAVAVTTLAIRHFSPRLVVVFGPARPHDPSLHSGDVVVAGKFVAFDGVESPLTPAGEGSHPLQWLRLDHAPMTPGEHERYVDSFPADPRGTALALALPPPPGGRVVRGVLGSAAQINREADRIACLHALWQTSTEDAESAFVAGCAGLLSTPIVGIRVVNGTPADAAAVALRFVEAWK